MIDFSPRPLRADHLAIRSARGYWWILSPIELVGLGGETLEEGPLTGVHAYPFLGLPDAVDRARLEADRIRRGRGSCQVCKGGGVRVVRAPAIDGGQEAYAVRCGNCSGTGRPAPAVVDCPECREGLTYRAESALFYSCGNCSGTGKVAQA